MRPLWHDSTPRQDASVLMYDENIPDSGSSEEYLIVGASKVALLVRVTDVAYVAKYPLLHADLKEGSK